MAKAISWTMVALQVACSAAYFSQGDLRRGTYWLAAAVLTVSVTA